MGLGLPHFLGNENHKKFTQNPRHFSMPNPQSERKNQKFFSRAGKLIFCTLFPVDNVGVRGTSAKTTLWKPPCLASPWTSYLLVVLVVTMNFRSSPTIVVMMILDAGSLDSMLTGPLHALLSLSSPCSSEVHIAKTFARYSGHLGLSGRSCE